MKGSGPLDMQKLLRCIFLSSILSVCFGQKPTLHLYGSKPDSGGWPVGKSLNWGAEQAIKEVQASGEFPFEVQISWHDDKCSRPVGMEQFISSVTAAEGRVFHGVIGSGCSSVCGGLHDIAPLYGLVVLSWGCSSPILSDGSTYPYFSRVSVSGAFHAIGWALLMRFFQWTQAGALRCCIE